MVNEQSRKHKRRILESLEKNGPSSTSELEKNTQLHRETISILCNQLISEGWIYNKENKHGKYRLTEKSIFYFPSGSNFRRKLISKFDKLPLVTEENNNLFNIDNKKLINDRDYFDKYGIFEFSNRIGALITYLIIQALHQKGLVPIDEISLNFKNSQFELIKGRDRNTIAQNFIDSVIDPDFLIQNFSVLRIVRTGLKINNPIKKNINLILKNLKQEEKIAIKEKNNDTRKKISKKMEELRKIKEFEMNPQDPYWSMYELDRETYNKLNQIYSELYPRFFGELEKIKAEVSKQK